MLNKPLRPESLGAEFTRMHESGGALPGASQRLLIFLCVRHLQQLPLVSDVAGLNQQSRSPVKLIKVLECFSDSFLGVAEVAENGTGEPGTGNSIRCSLLILSLSGVERVGF